MEVLYQLSYPGGSLTVAAGTSAQAARFRAALRSRSVGTTALPRNPAPPVTTTRLPYQKARSGARFG